MSAENVADRAVAELERLLAAAEQRAAQAEAEVAADRIKFFQLEQQRDEARADAALARELPDKFHEWTAAFPLSEDGSRDRKVDGDLYDEVYVFLSTPSSGAALLRELEGLRKVRETAEALDVIYGPHWGVSGEPSKNAWEALRAALRAVQLGGER